MNPVRAQQDVLFSMDGDAWGEMADVVVMKDVESDARCQVLVRTSEELWPERTKDEMQLGIR
jgi:hypothetical protein